MHKLCNASTAVKALHIGFSWQSIWLTQASHDLHWHTNCPAPASQDLHRGDKILSSNNAFWIFLDSQTGIKDFHRGVDTCFLVLSWHPSWPAQGSQKLSISFLTRKQNPEDLHSGENYFLHLSWHPNWHARPSQDLSISCKSVSSSSKLGRSCNCQSCSCQFEYQEGFKKQFSPQWRSCESCVQGFPTVEVLRSDTQEACTSFTVPPQWWKALCKSFLAPHLAYTIFIWPPQWGILLSRFLLMLKQVCISLSGLPQWWELFSESFPTLNLPWTMFARPP